MAASRSAPRPAVPERALPRGGRHPLTQEAVTASQRARLLDAMSHIAAAKGFKAATVADVIALAGVSRRTFYEQFDDMQACFLAAYERGMQALFGAIRRALRDTEALDWQARSRVAIRAYLQALAAAPEVTWAFSVETLGAGAQALERRGWVLDQWVAQWRALQALRERDDPQAPHVTDASLLAMVGGIEELVRDCLRRRGAAALPELADPVTHFVLAVMGAGSPGAPAG
ncbi:MAG: TetR/AcrR family transcriptional regulator [Ramlibacter sp.]|nr:TetR/AcrR family transcriptional regulator [Ramlibacter sp.]